MISQTERFLAACIFLLWSIGVVVLPYLGKAGLLPYLSDSAQHYTLLAYLGLHIVIAAYVVVALFNLLTPTRHKKHWWYLAVLYS